MINFQQIPQCRSRIHRLNTLDAFVKREDELGFGISGSKVRKFLSLIPELKNHKEVFVIGGFNSNHVVGILQRLIENNIPRKLFLREGYQEGINHSLIQLMTSEISLISRADWPRVHEIAKQQAGPDTFMLPEGGFVKESLPGALSLPFDIHQNGQEFDHIFVDAGTGLTAIALILGFAHLKKNSRIHVLLLAGSEKEFAQKLVSFGKELGISLPSNYQIHLPTNAASFGSANRAVFDEISFVAKNEGILTDPIYTGKLFYEARRLIPHLRGNKLIIHSGGAASLFGFLPQLQNAD